MLPDSHVNLPNNSPINLPVDFPFYDYHTHNGYYRGSFEDWTIQEGWIVAQKKGITRLGIANKVEFNHPHPDFIPLLREELDHLQNPNILLGIELDIGDPSGKNVFPGQYAKMLDYVIAGPHNQPIKSLLWPEIEEEALIEYFDSLHKMLLNSFNNAPVTIWAHPFLQEVQNTTNRFWKYIEPIVYSMMELCAKKGIALEINENYFRDKEPPKQAFQLKWWPSVKEYNTSKMTILKNIFTIAQNQKEIEFTFASDTHNLNNVGDIQESIQFSKALGIPQGRIKKIEKRES